LAALGRSWYRPAQETSQAEFRCLAYGHQAHTDVNAARNMLRAVLALQEAQKQPEKPLPQRAEES
jgi:transposase